MVENCRSAYPGVRRLLIDLDNGPEIASSRTQFMNRVVEFSDRHQLTLELAYYPPYHSKYNLIERCWGTRFHATDSTHDPVHFYLGFSYEGLRAWHVKPGPFPKR